MKNYSSASLCWISCLWVLFIGCNQPVTISKCDCCQQAYVIGYDQCLAKSTKVTGKGFVLAFPKTGDTLVTYNLPDSLYQFPEEVFKEYQLTFLFPATEQKSYPVFVSYHLVKPENKTHVACTNDIVTYLFSHVVRDREIAIDCARRTAP